MNSPRDVESPLPDLTEMDFSQLRSGDGDVLKSAVRRVREQANRDTVVAGFQSAI